MHIFAALKLLRQVFGKIHVGFALGTISHKDTVQQKYIVVNDWLGVSRRAGTL
jgi:hypothetical protein